MVEEIALGSLSQPSRRLFPRQFFSIRRLSRYILLHQNHQSGFSLSVIFPIGISTHALNELNEPFSLFELNAAIKANCSKIQSAPGLDLIDNIIIANLPNSIIQALLTSFSAIFTSGTFPELWKDFLIHFIPKGSTNKFRPISLAQSLLKVFQRLVHSRLAWWLEHNMKLPSTQFGFRKARSCQDNLSISEIYSSYAKGCYTAALFLDTKSAFDDIDADSIIHTLKDLGLPRSICLFYHNLISERSLYFNVNGKLTGLYLSRKRVPQGCVSSPTLYNLGTQKLESVVSDCQCLSFADDIVIFISSSDLTHSISTLQQNLNRISNYQKSLGLSLSPKKTKLVIFHDKISNTPDCTITLENCIIHPSPSAKFLGLTLDQKLTWTEHLNALTKKTTSCINIVSNSIKSLIASSIDYGLSCILSSCNKLFDKLGVIQRRALRLAIGLPNSTRNSRLRRRKHSSSTHKTTTTYSLLTLFSDASQSLATPLLTPSTSKASP